MKLKLDRATLDVFTRVTQYGLKLEYKNELVNWFFRSSLQSLIIKLARAITKRSKAVTLQFTPSEIICYYWTLEYWNEVKPNTYEYMTCQQYFLTLKTA